MRASILTYHSGNIAGNDTQATTFWRLPTISMSCERCGYLS